MVRVIICEERSRRGQFRVLYRQKDITEVFAFFPLIKMIRRDHDDLPLCAFLLDFSLFRRSAAADGEEDESDEDEEDDFLS